MSFSAALVHALEHTTMHLAVWQGAKQKTIVGTFAEERVKGVEMSTRGLREAFPHSAPALDRCAGVA